MTRIVLLARWRSDGDPVETQRRKEEEMKWFKLLVMLFILVLTLMLMSVGAVAGESEPTDGKVVSAEIVAGLPAASVAIETEAVLVYYDEVSTPVMLCFTEPSAAAPTRLNLNTAEYIYESELTNEPGRLLLWRNTRSATSPIHRWIRA